MKLKHISPIELKGYANNPNKHSRAQIAQIAEAIKEFGFKNPIVVDENMEVKAGHGRLEASLMLGLEKVPVIQYTDLTDAQWKAYVIADNQLARNSQWDKELLHRELIEISGAGIDLSITGLSGQEINELMDCPQDAGSKLNDNPDYIPEARVKHHRCDYGELWKLGRHVLMIGDNTDFSDVERLMGSDKASMLWTTPPRIAEAGMEDEFADNLTIMFQNCNRMLENGCPFYVAYPSQMPHIFTKAVNDSGLSVKQHLVWVKSHFTLSREDYQWQHESILYGWKPGAKHRWYGAFDKTTVAHLEGKALDRLTKAELLEILYGLKDGTDVIQTPKPINSALTKGAKPVDLVIPYLKNSSVHNDIVLDLCGTHGTTLIACEITGRRARLMEFDCKYADIIIRRYEELTGDKAVRM